MTITAVSDGGPSLLQRLRVPLGFVAAFAYLWFATRSPALSWTSFAVGGATHAGGGMSRVARPASHTLRH